MRCSRIAFEAVAKNLRRTGLRRGSARKLLSASSAKSKPIAHARTPALQPNIAKGGIRLTQSLQNKIAVVTGDTSGIGRATVVDCARYGVNVVASGRREERGAELVAEMQGLPGNVIFVRADVTVAKDVENLMSSAVAEFGHIDYAFNNAGGASPEFELGTRLHEYSDEKWNYYSDVFLKSVWKCMKHEIERMLPNRSSVAINNASVFGIRGGLGAHTSR